MSFLNKINLYTADQMGAMQETIDALQLKVQSIVSHTAFMMSGQISQKVAVLEADHKIAVRNADEARRLSNLFANMATGWSTNALQISDVLATAYAIQADQSTLVEVVVPAEIATFFENDFEGGDSEYGKKAIMLRGGGWVKPVTTPPFFIILHVLSH